MLELYRQYRHLLMELHSNIIKTVMPDMWKNSASRLGILKTTGDIDVHDKTENEYFFDFTLYERIHNNKSIIDIFLKNNKTLNMMEYELLLGMKRAFTSLYQIIEIKREKCQIILKDILNRERLITLTDINFSQTCKVNQILFTRIIELTNFNFTSGMTIIFKGTYKNKLLEECQKQSLFETDEIHRYISLFHMNRKIGLTMYTQIL